MKPQPITTAYDLTTGRGRLRYLADEVLARVTQKALPFTLAMWTGSFTDPLDENTSACAVGWACRDEMLQHQGLRFVEAAPLYYSPEYENKNGVNAVQTFFEIDIKTAASLFMAHRNCSNTAADVAARIRAHLAETERV